MAVQEPQQPSRLSFRVANGRPFHLDARELFMPYERCGGL